MTVSTARLTPTPSRSRVTHGAWTLVHPRGKLELRGRETYVVGQDPSCDLVIAEDRYVSARHAVLRPSGDTWRLDDLGSTNGTQVDGVPVERAWLRPGNQVRIGRTTLRVEGPTHQQQDALAKILGRSPAIEKARREIVKLAPLSHPAMIRGETGTGKELAARALHDLSPRAGAAFVAVNCAAIPAELAESELFGHARGAFTGAHRAHVGAFERADTGSLFLDEVAELPPTLQAKLLRVLETGRFTPVGAERELQVNVRVISATHRDLESMVEEHELREDLYHRLGVLEMRLPPLRERGEDIALLLEHFARRCESELGRPVHLCPRAIKEACEQAWPGNIRALRNALTRAAALSDGPIEAPELLVKARSRGPAQGPTVGAPAHSAQLLTVPRGDYASMNRALLESIVAEEGSIRKAAGVLGVPRSTLGNWLRSTKRGVPA